MARIRRLTNPDTILARLREVFTYPPGEDRATGYLYGDQDWPAPFADVGPVLRSEVAASYGQPFELVLFQAYRDGHACTASHVDAADQAIVSLGATRRFELADATLELRHGDLIFIPAGTPHGVPADPQTTGERCSLVFRSRGGT